MTTAALAMKAGAVDFLSKPVPPERLLAAVREGLARDAQVRARRTIRCRIRRMVDTLTPRERQVLEHIVRGFLNKDIAAHLEVSVKTIKVHRGRVMRKMQTRSAAELAHLFIEAGLI
jgi:FixJ family two-component response regulator